MHHESLPEAALTLARGDVEFLQLDASAVRFEADAADEHGTPVVLAVRDPKRSTMRPKRRSHCGELGQFRKGEHAPVVLGEHGAEESCELMPIRITGFSHRDHVLP